MQKAEIEFLKKKNHRYRLLKTDSQYYLLDADRPFLIVYFLPLLVYFVPHRCYSITQSEYELLTQEDYLKAQFRASLKQYGFRYSLGVGIVVTSLGRIFDINQYLNFSPGVFSYILAFCILLIVFSLRIWLSVAYRLPAGYQNRPWQRVFIFPRFFKRLLLLIFSYLVVAAMCFLIFYAFLTHQVDNYIVHIGLFTGTLICLIAGSFIFLAPNDYWVKIKD